MSRTGWCLSGDCDTGEARGGCPVQTGGLQPCTCLCHDGAAEPRGFLPITPRFAAEQPAEDSEPLGV